MARNRTIEAFGTDKMLVSGICTVTKERYAVEVPLQGWKRWKGGALIQNALPGLTAEQREFILSGNTPAEWDKLFPPEEE